MLLQANIDQAQEHHVPLAWGQRLFCTSRTAVRKAPAEVSGACLLFMMSTYLQQAWYHHHTATVFTLLID